MMMKTTNNAFGFILINKIEGPSSHHIINQLRKITDIKKIGHAGTLDPFAEGLMIVAIGRQATKNIANFVKLDKIYEAEVFLGIKTDTYDKCGKTTGTYKGPKIKKTEFVSALKDLVKKTSQIPPMYSAKKVNGKKLYELARKNIEIERLPQKIKIFYIKLKKYTWPTAKIEIHCSSGTYIRTIANDLGNNLGCGAHLRKLRRTKIGSYKLKKAKKIDQLKKENWKKYLFHLKNANIDKTI